MAKLAPGGPVLDLQAGHREVLRISSRQLRPRRQGRGCYEAIGLDQSHSPRGEVAPPSAGQFALACGERNHPKSVEQTADRILFPRSGATPDLLDVDCADQRRRFRRAHLAEALCRRSIAQHLDQHRGVEEQCRSAHPALVSSPLGANPGGRILIPFVPLVIDRADRGEDVIPPTLLVERAPQHPRDERTSAPLSDPLVQLGHEIILEAYV
jgi:hypothetical protein